MKEIIAKIFPPRVVDLLLGVLATVSFCVGMWFVFYKAPLLKLNGMPWWSQKIFYIHLPCAWGSLSGLLIVLIASIGYLVTRKESWDTLAVAATEICFIFATGVLITGPLWAKPSWNTFWNWGDPRLMSFFALWMILGAYFLLRNYGDSGEQVRVASASLGIIGALSVPFVYLSVRFAPGFHPNPNKMQFDLWVRITVHTLNFSFLFLFLLLMRVRRRLEENRNLARRIKLHCDELD
ncbi:MAG TPA: hypothetical protein DCE42_30050 [Myxococcales bacterium]|nr:hypothetical protein [Deltaproteobacteria bacterium]HAA59035.1 hypothetical protein [Myxococcales bacterium]|tara:strand:- start:1181 stop:1891 length:711 start_codon:yes stop_codon:yes gene_type:complete